MDSPLWDTAAPQMITLTVGRMLAIFAAILLLVSTFNSTNAKQHNINIFIMSTMIAIQFVIAFTVKLPDGTHIYDLSLSLGLAIFIFVLVNNFSFGDIRLNSIPTFMVLAFTIYTEIHEAAATEQNYILITYLVCIWPISILATIAQNRQSLSLIHI